MLDSELSHLSDDRKVIVFVNTKRQCDAVQRHLEPQGYNCAVLHGGKDQNQREASLLGFREGRYNVLIATDVAGEQQLCVVYHLPGRTKGLHSLYKAGEHIQPGHSALPPVLLRCCWHVGCC